MASLFVQPEGSGAGYVPGQYATLGIADGDRVIQRPYSMAAPHASDGAWEFHVRRVRGGGCLTMPLAACRCPPYADR